MIYTTAFVCLYETKTSMKYESEGGLSEHDLLSIKKYRECTRVMLSNPTQTFNNCSYDLFRVEYCSYGSNKRKRPVS